MMMELNKNRNTLIERTWDLRSRIDERIHYDNVSFCKHCLEHGMCCGIAETTAEERRRLIAIRDSLKGVQDMLVFLQALESSMQQHEHAAFARLEASRLLLLERINQYPREGRKLDVLEELNSCFADKEATFTWKFKEKKEKSMETTAKYGISGSVIKCIKSLFNPWNWYNTARIAIKLVAVSTIISASIDVYRSRQHYFRSQRKILWPKGKKIAGKLKCSLKDDSTSHSTSHIAVLRGRG